MRILTVSGFFESHGGGVEIVAGALARALGRRGCDSVLAAAALDPAPDSKYVRHVPLASRDPIERRLGLPLPLPSRAARKRLCAEVAQADGLIIHDALYANSLIAAREASRLGKPWILVQHIGAIPYTSAVARSLLRIANATVTRRMLETASQAVFISDAVRRHFAQVQFKVEPKLLFNGVDHGTFAMVDPSERDALRTSLGLREERPALVFVGRFVEKKGLAVLRRMARSRPDWDFLVVGSGPIDPSTWDLPNVRLPGRKSRSELAELYNAVDALVLPSAGEGFPLVIQEAMACGLKVYCGLDSAAADPDASRFLEGIAVDLADADATSARFIAAIEGTRFDRSREMARYAATAYDWDSNAAWIEQRLKKLSS